MKATLTSKGQMRAVVGCASGKLGKTSDEWLDETRGRVQAELRRLELLAETDRYVADLVAEVGPPTAAQHTRASAVARRLARRPTRQPG